MRTGASAQSKLLYPRTFISSENKGQPQATMTEWTLLKRLLDAPGKQSLKMPDYVVVSPYSLTVDQY